MEKQETGTKSKVIEVDDVFQAWGTEIAARLIAENETLAAKARQDIQIIRVEYARHEKIFSRFSRESELFHLNDNLHFSNEASRDIIELSRRALQYYQETKGIFDPRIVGDLERIGYREDFKKGKFKLSPIDKAKVNPFETDLALDISISKGRLTFHARMDFGGIAKGYMTDIVAATLLAKGWQNFFINSGGDIFFAGKDGADDWYFGVEGVEDKQLLLRAGDCGVATSGIGRRKWEIGSKKFHHLIDPRKPDNFSFDLKTVTVIAKTTEEADIWAKTLFILGKKEGAALALRRKIKCVFLDYRGNIWISPPMQEHVYRK